MDLLNRFLIGFFGLLICGYFVVTFYGQIISYAAIIPAGIFGMVLVKAAYDFLMELLN